MEAPSSIERHAELLFQRTRKTFRHFRKRFEKQNIGCYRLYDWTIPEVRARVDYYEGHVVVAEYVRQQTASLEGYLEALGSAVAAAVGIGPDCVHLKRRRTRQHRSARDRYEKLASHGERLVVRERTLEFWVNLEDYIDTGLFVDHRETRALLTRVAAGKDVLNLYCYSGSLTAAVARGKARTTVSVDLSPGYLGWAKDNLRLNALDSPAHTFVLADCREFLKDARARGRTWDIIIVDPPSFSTVGSFSEEVAEFDVLEAHPRLLAEALGCLAPGGCVLFSTNHQRFVPRMEGLGIAVREITQQTVPEDFRQRGPFQPNPVHRCFVLGGRL